MLALRGRETRPGTNRGFGVGYPAEGSSIGHIADYADGTSRVVELFSWSLQHWEISIKRRDSRGKLRYSSVIAHTREFALGLYSEERQRDLKRGTRVVLLSAI